MRQAGFTLLEILIAVALVGILVGLAVVAFSKQARKARGSEANGMFMALRVAEEHYHLENGTYLSTGLNETDTHPATPVKTRQSFTPMPATWIQLKVDLPEEDGFCGYVVITGDGGDASNLGVKAAEFGLATAPSTDWYYILAHCDLDGDATLDTYYFTWSGDTKIQKQNEGY